MFDKLRFFSDLRGLKVGQSSAMTLEGEADVHAFQEAAREFADRYSVKMDAFAGKIGPGFAGECTMQYISPGSPLNSRTFKPWHALAPGESRFVPESEVKNPSNFRSYVAIHGAKVNHALSVSKTDGGYFVIRKEAP